MGILGSILGMFAESFSDSIKSQTGVDLYKEFENTRKTHNEYKKNKKIYNYLNENKDELIEKLGEEEYSGLLQERKEIMKESGNLFGNSLTSDLNNLPGDTYEAIYNKAKSMFHKMKNEQLLRINIDALTEPQKDAYYDECNKRGI